MPGGRPVRPTAGMAGVPQSVPGRRGLRSSATAMGGRRRRWASAEILRIVERARTTNRQTIVEEVLEQARAAVTVLDKIEQEMPS